VKKKSNDYYFNVRRSKKDITTSVRVGMKGELREFIKLMDFSTDWQTCKNPFYGRKIKDYYEERIFPALEKSQRKILLDIYNACSTHEEALEEMFGLYSLQMCQDLPPIPQKLWDHVEDLKLKGRNYKKEDERKYQDWLIKNSNYL